MKLYPHQLSGAKWLADRSRAWLCDPMGIGKTATGVTAAVLRGAARPLVLCTRSAVPTWERTPAALGVPAFRIETFGRAIRSEHLAALESYDPDLVIVDEAHRLRRLESKQTKVCLEIASRAETVWLLTGTPMPNGPHELYAPMAALWPEVMHELGAKSYFDWLKMFCVWKQTKFGIKVLGAKNKPLLHELLFGQGRMLRRDYEEAGLTLPPFFWQNEIVEGCKTPELLKLEEEARTEIEEGLDPNPGATSRMRRILGMAKVVPVTELLLDALESGAMEKVVVFYHHTEVGDFIDSSLAGAGHHFYRVDGSTSPSSRKIAESAFQQNPATRVFLGQIQAAGESLTLTAANQVWIVEPSWVPDENEQAAKRCHRIGQHLPVIAKVFSLKDSLDDGINESNLRKLRMKEGVTD